jgi:hypothetical protein
MLRSEDLIWLLCPTIKAEVEDLKVPPKNVQAGSRFPKFSSALKEVQCEDSCLRFVGEGP